MRRKTSIIRACRKGTRCGGTYFTGFRGKSGFASSPLPGRECEGADHFVTFEWLRQDVVGAQVQSFHPQAIVGLTRGDDEQRGGAQFGGVGGHGAPVFRIVIVVPDDEGDSAAENFVECRLGGKR